MIPNRAKDTIRVKASLFTGSSWSFHSQYDLVIP